MKITIEVTKGQGMNKGTITGVLHIDGEFFKEIGMPTTDKAF